MTDVKDLSTPLEMNRDTLPPPYRPYKFAVSTEREGGYVMYPDIPQKGLPQPSKPGSDGKVCQNRHSPFRKVMIGLAIYVGYKILSGN